MTHTHAHSQRSEAGLSLIELLVAVAVFAILFLIIDGVFRSAHLGARKAELAADAQQNARVAMARLTRELRESRASLVSCSPTASCPSGSTQIAFPSARPGDDSSGIFCIDVATDDLQAATLVSECDPDPPLTGTYTPVWQRYIGYHVNSSGELRRVTQASPIALPMADGEGEVLARSIDSFEIARSGSAVTVTLKVNSQALEDLQRVQGAPLPAQEVLMEGVVDARN